MAGNYKRSSFTIEYNKCCIYLKNTVSLLYLRKRKKWYMIWFFFFNFEWWQFLIFFLNIVFHWRFISGMYTAYSFFVIIFCFLKDIYNFFLFVLSKRTYYILISKINFYICHINNRWVRKFYQSGRIFAADHSISFKRLSYWSIMGKHYWVITTQKEKL